MLDHAALRLYALALPDRDPAEWVGQRIHFWGQSTDVLTSPIVSVGRPRIDEVFDYVSQARAGVIHDDPSPELQACLPAVA